MLSQNSPQSNNRHSPLTGTNCTSAYLTPTHPERGIYIRVTYIDPKRKLPLDKQLHITNQHQTC